MIMNTKSLDAISVSDKVAKSVAGQQYILPHNRAYSLRAGSRTVYADDLVKRPAFYIAVDPRLAEKIGLTKEQAFDLREEFKLSEIAGYYAAKQTKKLESENTNRQASVSGANKSKDNGKGSAS